MNVKTTYKRLGRDGGIKREKQLLVDYLCSSAGGPIYYTGREMKLSHDGMKISGKDCSKFLGMQVKLWQH